jgi:radical SAM superfamily enzyme
MLREKLRALYDEALNQEDVIGLSIGTRPECIGPHVVELLSDTRKVSCLGRAGAAICS